MTTLDDEQEKVADWITDRLRGVEPSSEALLHLGGQPGSGKTTVMRLVAQRLREDGRYPVFLPSAHADADSGAVALAEAADALQAAQLLNGEAQTIRDPKAPWSTKVKALKEAISKHADDVVLLCDEPVTWYSTSDATSADMPQSAIRGLAEWFVRDAPCKRIVGGALLETSAPYAQSLPPSLSNPALQWSESGADAPLPECETELLELLLPDGRKLTPLRLKIGLALTHFMPSRRVAERLKYGTNLESLIGELLAGFEQTPELCVALSKVAIVRSGIRFEVYRDLSGPLTNSHRRIVEYLLCETRNDLRTLHPVVQTQVLERVLNVGRSWRLSRESVRQVHLALAAECGGQPGSVLRQDVESLYHELLGEPGRRSINDPRLHCIEQLQAIGRALSYQQHDFASAADVFDFALGVAPDDAYSHHYLAFNLDHLASDEGRVERHYQEAIKLRSSHPWYWSRWISYLLTRGRATAARLAWEQANDVLCPSEQSPDWLFLALHRWVARWLLHWGELDFAENVLSAIPQTVSDSDASVRTLKDLLLALRQAERGTSVYPLSIPASEWWSPNPRTDLPLEYKGERLRKWLPARVDSVDVEEGEVFLTTGEKADAGDEDPIYREMMLTRKEIEESAHNWSWDDLGEGRFVELGYYDGDQPERIGLHRTTEWRDRHLLPLVPPPDRWYQRAVTESWTTVNRGE